MTQYAAITKLPGRQAGAPLRLPACVQLLLLLASTLLVTLVYLYIYICVSSMLLYLVVSKSIMRLFGGACVQFTCTMRIFAATKLY